MQAKGLSLIEVLIALLILVAGFVVLVRFQADLSRNTTMINQQLTAKTLAEDKLNELRHFSVINTTPGATAYADIVSGSASTLKQRILYTTTWTVTEADTPPRKTIRVSVTWTDQTNTARSITLESIVGRTDPFISGSISQSL